MLRVRRPSDVEISACLSAQRLPFSYSEVGATADARATWPDSVSNRYDIDHYAFPLGVGDALYERACAALFGWRHFEFPWLDLHRGPEPAHTGQVVATLVSVMGVWFLNPCRVVFVSDSLASPHTTAFAYGTLPGHAAQGEERFEVSLDPETGEVRYEILAFSRPVIPIVRLGYPLARRIQRRFAASSAEALTRAAAGAGSQRSRA